MRWPWARTLTREELKARQRAQALNPPKIVIRGQRRPLIAVLTVKRLLTSAGWLGGWVFLTWSAADILGPWAWKLGAGVGLVSAAGVVPLWRIVVWGLAECSWSQWFVDEERR